MKNIWKNSTLIIISFALIFACSVNLNVYGAINKIEKVTVSKCTSYYDSKIEHAPKVTVKWKKVKNVTGYQIYMSSNGEKYKKVATSKKNTYTKTFTDLGYQDHGMALGISKEYYFKIRAYKKNSGKIKYGKFSDTKKVELYRDTYLGRNIVSLYRDLEDSVKFPASIVVNSIKIGMKVNPENLRYSEITGQHIADKVIYIDYTAKNEFNQDRRAYFRGVISPSEKNPEKASVKTQNCSQILDEDKYTIFDYNEYKKLFAK